MKWRCSSHHERVRWSGRGCSQGVSDCEYSCRTGCGSGATCGQFPLNFSHSHLVQRINDESTGFEQCKKCWRDRKRERDAEQCVCSLNRFRHEAELPQEQRQEKTP